MQKKTARIIATLALTGCGVVMSAAAADAAAAPQPRQVSSTTCAGLAADLTTTVGEVVKALTGTPPNLAAATTLIADATGLSNAISSLGCSNVSLPSVPSVPSVPSAPSAAGAAGGSPLSGVTGTVGSVASGATGALSGVTGAASGATGALTGATGAAPTL